MKYYIPILCVVCIAIGVYAGSKYKEREFVGVYEHGVVWESAIDTRLHTVVLNRLQEGKIEEAIGTLEASLVITETLLETCQSPSFQDANSIVIKEAKSLIEEYHEKYPNQGIE